MPVTPLAKLVQEVHRINVFLVHQPNFSTRVLVGILVQMDRRIIQQ